MSLSELEAGLLHSHADSERLIWALVGMLAGGDVIEDKTIIFICTATL